MKIIRPILIIFILFSLILFINCGGKKDVNQGPGSVKRLEPGTPQYYLYQGINYLNRGNLALAEKRLNQALEKDPNLTAAANGLGILYLQKRNFDKAALYFRRVIEMNPKYWDAYNYLGIIFTETRKYALAKENFLKAANGNTYRTPENPYTNLAMLEAEHNRLNSAMRYIEKGMACKKDFAPLYNVKGIVHEKRKEYEQAVQAYEKALSLLTDEDPSYLVNLGRTYALMGNKPTAFDILEKAMAISTSPAMKTQIRKLMEGLEDKSN